MRHKLHRTARMGYSGLHEPEDIWKRKPGECSKQNRECANSELNGGQCSRENDCEGCDRFWRASNRKRKGDPK